MQTEPCITWASLNCHFAIGHPKLTLERKPFQSYPFQIINISNCAKKKSFILKNNCTRAAVKENKPKFVLRLEVWTREATSSSCRHFTRVYVTHVFIMHVLSQNTAHGHAKLRFTFQSLTTAPSFLLHTSARHGRCGFRFGTKSGSAALGVRSLHESSVPRCIFILTMTCHHI